MKKLIFILLFFSLQIPGSGNLFSQSIDSAEYFFDSDPGIGNGNLIIISQGDSILDTTSITTAGLNTGFHKIYFRVKDTNNVWSLYEGASFYLNDTLQIPIASFDSTSAEYFFNSDPGVGNGTSALVAAGDSIYDTISVSTAGLSTGFNWLFIRTKDSSEKWGLYEGLIFYLQDSVAAPASPLLSASEYFFDSDPGIGNGFPGNSFSYTDSVLINDTLPTSPLAAGTHNLFFRVKDSMNTWSLYEGGTFIICNYVPKPDFTSDTVCFNSPTTLTDLSTDLDTSANFTYNWDFDSNGISDDTTEGNTIHIFSSPGTHTVTLIVNNLNGCVDTVIKTIYVDSLPVVSLVLSDDTLCKLDTLVLSGGTPAGGIYSGPGVYNGIFYADSTSAGYKTITYTYINSDSCSAQATKAVFVNNCTGISDLATVSLNVSIHPNPFSEFAVLKITNRLTYGKNDLQLNLYDVFGKKIRYYNITESSLVIDKNGIPNGVYCYKLFYKGKLAGTGKIIASE